MAEPFGVLLTVAYDGGPFHGFARQPSQRTVAGELLGALQVVDPHIREIRGSSRTDAGVHALGQRVAFDTEAPLPCRGWVLATNRHLPREIAAVRAAKVRPGFIPRFESVLKCYRYVLFRAAVRDPFLDGRAWRISGIGEPEAIQRAQAEASLATGTHDFAAFRSSSDDRENTIRTIVSATVDIDPRDPRLVTITVVGKAFMHNMVRILVGTIVDVARGHREAGAISRALASKNRRDAGITAPPDGLCLDWVELTDEGEEAWGEGPAIRKASPPEA